MIDIAKKIKDAREFRDMSQPELGRRCGWAKGQTRISNYETGERKPGLLELETIASALDMSLVQLLYFGEDDLVRPMLTDGEFGWLQTYRDMEPDERKGAFGAIRVYRSTADPGKSASGETENAALGKKTS